MARVAEPPVAVVSQHLGDAGFEKAQVEAMTAAMGEEWVAKAGSDNGLRESKKAELMKKLNETSSMKRGWKKIAFASVFGLIVYMCCMALLLYGINEYSKDMRPDAETGTPTLQTPEGKPIATPDPVDHGFDLQDLNDAPLPYLAGLKDVISIDDDGQSSTYFKVSQIDKRSNRVVIQTWSGSIITVWQNKTVTVWGRVITPDGVTKDPQVSELDGLGCDGKPKTRNTMTSAKVNSAFKKIPQSGPVKAPAPNPTRRLFSDDIDTQNTKDQSSQEKAMPRRLDSGCPAPSYSDDESWW